LPGLLENGISDLSFCLTPPEKWQKIRAEKLMTEAEWLACTNPYTMLDALKATLSWSEGKVRLFAYWCVRQVWHLLSDQRSRNALEVAERFDVGRATKAELLAAEEAAEVAYAEACEAGGEADETAAAEAAGAAAAAVWRFSTDYDNVARDVIDAAKGAAAGQAAAVAALEAAETAERAGTAVEEAQADKLREMFGNPFARLLGTKRSPR
jgi:hypothetical protein